MNLSVITNVLLMVFTAFTIVVMIGGTWAAAGFIGFDKSKK